MEIIIQADTVESAIYEGLKKINKNRNDVKITVLEKGDKDFLGLTGNKNAKIKIDYDDLQNNSQPQELNFSQPQKERPSKKPQSTESESQQSTRKNPETQPRKQTTYTEAEIAESEALLEWIFKKINFSEFTLKSSVQDGAIIIEIISPDSSLIIGKHGKTLNAFQLIINTVINNKREKKLNILLDSENYRTKREQALKRMTDKYIQKLKYSKKDVTLPPMNNTERKIIHNYLTNKSGVKSESVGVEPTRRIKLKFER